MGWWYCLDQASKGKQKMEAYYSRKIFDGWKY